MAVGSTSALCIWRYQTTREKIYPPLPTVPLEDVLVAKNFDGYYLVLLHIKDCVR